MLESLNWGKQCLIWYKETTYLQIDFDTDPETEASYSFL